MLIPLSDIKHVYQYILERALECDGLGNSIYIFASNDTDSLSALKILMVSIARSSLPESAQV
jgi:hypothetical protein